MDYENKHKNGPRISSILQSNDMFSSKILARQSTVGSCSSRFFYRAAEGVPFQWEKRPGTAITAQPEDVVPPISPPPAVVAMGLPKPCINLMGEPKPRRWSSAWFVNKIRKIKLEGYNMINLGGTKKICYSEKYPNFGSQRYVCDSGRLSTSSFSSSFTSSLNGSFRDYKNSSNGNLQAKAFTCGPKRLSDMVVYFVRKE
ncbi:hypothetical protein RND81_07G083900 [Saponaria officinalis]|uniref:Uncharacterized protein n=1 Tax=Saponaria officinalis TaxID=3572 RepID=A0AAW1JNW6_SAPOF